MATHSSNSIVKFADDTVVLGLIFNNDETAYMDEVDNLTGVSAKPGSLWQTSVRDSSGPTPLSTKMTRTELIQAQSKKARHRLESALGY